MLFSVLKSPVFSEALLPKPPIFKPLVEHVYHFHIWVPHLERLGHNDIVFYDIWYTVDFLRSASETYCSQYAPLQVWRGLMEHCREHPIFLYII